MQYISYLLFRLFRNLMIITPFWFIYLFSDFIFVLIYYVFGYRKGVVSQNIENSFPDKNKQEIKTIVRKYYRHLSDNIVESVKGYGMNTKQLHKRYKVTNPEILEEYYNSGQNLIALASHYGNWEWGISSVATQFNHQCISLYMPMSNKYVEDYMKKIRAKGGMQLVSVKDTKEAFSANREKPAMFIMAADQNPGKLDYAIWMKFMNQITPCLHGPEAYSKKYDLPLIYFNVQKVKRGYYTLEVTKLIDNPRDTGLGDITIEYMRTVESVITAKPEYYLWSHRRWKRSGKYQEYGKEKFPGLDQ